MSDFLAMGGYAFYVWSAYSLALIVLLGLLLNSRARHQRIVKQLQKKMQANMYPMQTKADQSRQNGQ